MVIQQWIIIQSSRHMHPTTTNLPMAHTVHVWLLQLSRKTYETFLQYLMNTYTQVLYYAMEPSFWHRYVPLAAKSSSNSTYSWICGSLITSSRYISLCVRHISHVWRFDKPPCIIQSDPMIVQENKAGLCLRHSNRSRQLLFKHIEPETKLCHFADERF